MTLITELWSDIYLDWKSHCRFIICGCVLNLKTQANEWKVTGHRLKRGLKGDCTITVAHITLSEYTPTTCSRNRDDSRLLSLDKGHILLYIFTAITLPFCDPIDCSVGKRQQETLRLETLGQILWNTLLGLRLIQKERESECVIEDPML